MFIVLRVEVLNDHLRGYIGRFLHELDTGTYIGKTSRIVADKLWERVEENSDQGRAWMAISRSDREEGFEIQSTGSWEFYAADYDGITLILRKTNHVSAGE